MTVVQHRAREEQSGIPNIKMGERQVNDSAVLLLMVLFRLNGNLIEWQQNEDEIKLFFKKIGFHLLGI